MKTYFIGVRLDQRDYERLMLMCDKARCGVSKVIRMLIENGTIYERPSRDYRTLARAIDRIGANINQIAHMANITRSVGENEVQKLQLEILSLQKEIEAWKKQWL